MIRYSQQYFGCSVLCRFRGSVFLRVLPVTLPATLAAVGLCIFWIEREKIDNGLLPEPGSWTPSGFNLVYGGYTSVLAFMIVFRSNYSYTRYWEGAQCISKTRTVWLNAVSNLLAFCDRENVSQKPKVQEFQQMLVKLMSMLFCESLRGCMQVGEDTLKTLATEGIEETSLHFVDNCSGKATVILQWIQHLIIEADNENIIKIKAPILSRVFQELSNGAVNMSQAQNIADVQFPFPYTQLITMLLFFHTLMTPSLAAIVIPHPVWCGIITFMVLQSVWCLQAIAQEIDEPFGHDANDLPVEEYMSDFNAHLLLLLEPLAQRRPCYTLQQSVKESEGSRKQHLPHSHSSSDKDLTEVVSPKNIMVTPIPESAGTSLPDNTTPENKRITSQTAVTLGNSSRNPASSGHGDQYTTHLGVLGDSPARSGHGAQYTSCEGVSDDRLASSGNRAQYTTHFGESGDLSREEVTLPASAGFEI